MLPCCFLEKIGTTLKQTELGINKVVTLYISIL